MPDIYLGGQVKYQLRSELLEGGLDPFPVAHIQLEELMTSQVFAPAGIKIIQHCHLMPGSSQGVREIGTYKASSACYQSSHCGTSTLKVKRFAPISALRARLG